jgi:hypothetical protein
VWDIIGAVVVSSHNLYILKHCFVSGSGSKRAKMTHNNRKKIINFMFSSVECSLLRLKACSLDVLYEGLGIEPEGKLQFLIKKI